MYTILLGKDIFIDGPAYSGIVVKSKRRANDLLRHLKMRRYERIETTQRKLSVVELTIKK